MYWFARSVDAVARALPAGADYESIAEVDAPMMMGPGGGGGRGGPPMGGPMMGGNMPGIPPGGNFGPMRGGRGGMGPAGRMRQGGPGADEFGGTPAKLRLIRIVLPLADPRVSAAVPLKPAQ